tara:strand:- start:290 stop:940 length:651 start_codon:yes stop_codon:yes gene_type:complete
MFVLKKNLSENLENYKSFLRIALRESNPKSIINLTHANLFPFKKIYVNINEIEISEAKISAMNDGISGRFICDGNWDLSLVSLRDHPAINAAYLVSKYDLTWNEVGEVERIYNLVRKYGSFDKCRSRLQVKQRLDSLSNLINKIKYKDSKALNKNSILPLTINAPQIAIGRKGQFVKVGTGQHRLGIALGLSIDKVAFSLRAIHPLFLKNYKNNQC